MNRVFADTFYFLALVNPRDEVHQRALDWTMAFEGQLVTTTWVLAEFGNHMSDRRNRQEFVDTVRDLRSNQQVTIVAAERELFEDGFSLYASRLDKDWSLTDCISFVSMQSSGIREALTGDRHFEQAGFVALLK